MVRSNAGDEWSGALEITQHTGWDVGSSTGAVRSGGEGPENVNLALDLRQGRKRPQIHGDQMKTPNVDINGWLPVASKWKGPSFLLDIKSQGPSLVSYVSVCGQDDQ